MKMMVLRAASRIKSRKGLLALKIFLFIGKERPEMVTAVAAEASLPSSFTCQPRDKMELKYRYYAAWRGLTLLLLHRTWRERNRTVRASLPPKLQTH